jgi:predicted metal-dependent hydrolase
MAFKVFLIDDHKITIYKRKTAKNLRLSIGTRGEVKVSIPLWAPYQSGLEFALSKRDWIESNKFISPNLVSGQAVGKGHHLKFIASPDKLRPTTRIKGSEIIITYPASITYTDPTVQIAAQKASLRALKLQAETLLPQRLATLAEKYGFTYNSVSIKNLKSRWGSCDSKLNIVLNLFLMQLPWNLIDYVLMHELTHTRLMKHGPEFWEAMEANMPNTKELRKSMRAHKPIVSSPEHT